jgi:hypothetical protein
MNTSLSSRRVSRLKIVYMIALINTTEEVVEQFTNWFTDTPGEHHKRLPLTRAIFLDECPTLEAVREIYGLAFKDALEDAGIEAEEERPT